MPAPSRRKELLAQYKQHKPLMGVLSVLGPLERQFYLAASGRVEALVNRTRFQLEMGSHPVAALQKAWNESGGQGFQIAVMRALPEDMLQEDDDPQEALAMLEMMCRDEMTGQGKSPF